MISLIQFLSNHGLMLLGGSTVLLTAGTLALTLQRSPVQRQRLGELTILCTLLWIVTACLPLPRWRPSVTQVRENPSLVTSYNLPAREMPPAIPITALATPADAPHLTVPIVAEGTNTFSKAEPLPAPITMHPSSPEIDYAAIAAFAFLIGSAVSIGWLALGHLLLWRLLRGTIHAPPWLDASFSAISEEFGLHRVRLLICRRPTRPFSFGLLRPTVVIDIETATTQSAASLRQIFRHELSHLRRRDAWGNARLNLAMPLLYIHPIYWWLRSRTFLARELIADAEAAANDRIAYAADLLALAKWRRAARPGPVGAIGMFHFTTNLYRRIVMLTQRQTSFSSKCSSRWRFGWLAASAAALIIMCSTLGVGRAGAQVASDQTQSTKRSDAAGDEAAARQRLENLDNQQQDADAAKRHAEVSQLELQLKLNQAQVDALQQQLRNLQAQRQTYDPRSRPADQHQVKALEIELAMAVAQLDHDRLVFERSRPLFEKKAISDLQFQEAESAVRMDTLKVQRAQEELARTKDEISSGSRSTSNGHVDPMQAAASGPMIRGELDLVNLANSYANALGEVRLARAKLNSGPRNTAVSQAEVENAVSKYEMLRRIAEVALKHAQDELKLTQTGVKQGVVSYSELTPVTARVNILEAILHTSADTPAKQ